LKIQLIALLFALTGFASCANNPVQMKDKPAEEKLFYSGKTFENIDVSSLGRKKNELSPRVLEFDQCTFKGTVRFGPLEEVYQSLPITLLFKNCSFEGDVIGDQIQFLGEISFNKCRFKKVFSARNSVFHAPAGFRDCGFDGDVQFQNAVFLKESTWQASHFYAISFFQSVRFFEKAQFSNAFFHGNADFTLCRFSEGAAFDFVKSEGNLDLSESRQEELMTFRKAELLKRTTLNGLRSFGQIRFLYTRFEDSLTTKGARFFAEKPEIINPQGGVSPTLSY
jgi:hypothetical protein